MGNPMIEEKITEASLDVSLFYFFQALLICAASYEDNMELLNDDEKYKSIFDKFQVNLLKNMEQDKGWNIFSKIKMFKEYLNYYMDVPIYTEERESKPTTPSGTDWKQNIYLTFKKLGYQESEILNMNFLKLFYEWCSYAEGEGAIKVMNSMDLYQLNRLKGIK
jgi:hypothetical protein